MQNNFEYKDSYNVNDLEKIVELLRDKENGCPWDKEQNHSSIRNNFIEEVYEVADAIDREDTAALREELGDVLLQVLFHTQMEKEKGGFCFDDVSDEICKKLILRHPHIFGDVKADTTEKVLDNWDKIKMVEKGQSSYSDTLESVPASFPALMRAAKVQKRAAKANFDSDSVYGSLLQVGEVLDGLEQAIEDEECSCSVARELGELLFAVVNLSRFVMVDAEQALYDATESFISRFKRLEECAAAEGIDMKQASREQLDSMWEQVGESDEAE